MRVTSAVYWKKINLVETLIVVSQAHEEQPHGSAPILRSLYPQSSEFCFIWQPCNLNVGVFPLLKDEG